MGAAPAQIGKTIAESTASAADKDAYGAALKKYEAKKSAEASAGAKPDFEKVLNTIKQQEAKATPAAPPASTPTPPSPPAPAAVVAPPAGPVPDQAKAVAQQEFAVALQKAKEQAEAKKQALQTAYQSPFKTTSLAKKSKDPYGDKLKAYQLGLLTGKPPENTFTVGTGAGAPINTAFGMTPAEDAKLQQLLAVIKGTSAPQGN